MTLDEAINHAEEVADKKDREKQKWERWLENDSDYRAVAEKVSCELCAEEHRQLAEWLKELKQLMEQVSRSENQNKWIPVSERLPEKNMACLVSVGKFNLTQTAMYSNLMGTIDHRIFYQGDYGDNSFEDITEYVNAWMSLPEPYKAESEVEDG